MDKLWVAIHETARKYRGGTKNKGGIHAMALAMSVHPGTFRNKVDPSCPNHIPNINEIRAMMLMSGDCRILHALASDVNHACFPLPNIRFPSDTDLIEAWASWQGEVAETVQQVKRAIAERCITQAEIRDIDQELQKDFAHGMAMLEVLKGMAEPPEEE
uniref:Phage regulatory protein CII (CP76) n=1 Tax=Candidatus Kentrum sp. LFY TaxID=2126342 RepID=A0A450WD53_9GAMM|nr:MAG: hypothetical protein BECKLFY1418C_GA0070996_10127 [Candidatus Kentron sp. LFY]